MTVWQSYEDAARSILEQLGKHIGIEKVSGYRNLTGTSGTSWEVEATAIRSGDGGTLIVECRRHTTRGLSQESVAGLAFRIQDTRSSGGIIVTPRPLQKGAKYVADSKDILHFRLDVLSTPEDYLAEFMGHRFHGVSFKSGAVVSDSCRIDVVRRSVDRKDEN